VSYNKKYDVAALNGLLHLVQRELGDLSTHQVHKFTVPTVTVGTGPLQYDWLFYHSLKY